MKKAIFLIIFISMFCAAPSLIIAGTSGCGVGTNIWKGDRGVTAHTSANTTNNISSRPLSVTSGTSGCEGADTKSVQNEREIKLFLSTNYYNVAEEMSQGQGEFLGTYASLFGCHQNAMDKFNQTTQKNYDLIFSNPESTTNIIKQTHLVLARDQQLSKSCSHL